MTTKNKENLIGYDPLAWMNEESDSESSKKSQDQETMENLDALVSDRAISEAMINQGMEKQDSVETEPELDENTETEAWVESENNSKIILESTLNIQNVTELHDSLLTSITDNDNLEIDASAVIAIDTASLQLLAILKQESIKLNKEVSFDFPSDKFIEAAELLGIEELLGVNHAAAGFF